MNNEPSPDMTTLPISPVYRQRGFSLIEALVAFLILSVGMLGIASLQTISLKAGYTATLRSSAVSKNEAILERIRANRAAIDSGSGSVYNGTFDTSYTTTRLCSDSTGTIVTCNSDQMAAFDIYELMQDIKNEFPTGTTATITVADSAAKTPHLVTVTITWKERDPANGNNTIDMKYITDQLICDSTC
jgi:type IV pilus assembly protein PilV